MKGNVAASISTGDAEHASNSELVLYQTKDGPTRIQCRFEDESIWLTQRLIGELFGKDVRTIQEHIANLYEEGELLRDATIRNFRLVRTDGNRSVSRDVEHYNLAMIVAVDFRVRSQRGLQFRQWANERLVDLQQACAMVWCIWLIFNQRANSRGQIAGCNWHVYCICLGL